MSIDNLILERTAATMVVTINRPEVRNALDAATLAELAQLLDQVRDDATVRVLILTGSGNKAFAAGADIRELAALSPSAAADHARLGQQVFDRLETLGKPVIAAINGVALGGGCELALACTFRIASETARLGQPEIDLGLLPGFGGTQRLPRLIGRGAALDLLLTGRQVDAAEALRLGLVTRVVTSDTLMPEAGALAQRLASKPALAVRAILQAVALERDVPLVAGLAFEASLFGLLTASDDMREGTAAFLAKRPPVFKGVL